MELLFYWLYMSFSYILPGVLLFYSFVIENIFNKEVTLMTKLGASGIFALVVCIIICIVFVNKVFTKREQKYEKLSVKEINLEKRKEYILKWTKTEKIHNIFKQCIMLSVLIVVAMLVILLESKLLALRGTMITMAVLFGIGTVFYAVYENIKQKKLNKGEDSEKGFNQKG